MRFIITRKELFTGLSLFTLLILFTASLNALDKPVQKSGSPVTPATNNSSPGQVRQPVRVYPQNAEKPGPASMQSTTFSHTPGAFFTAGQPLTLTVKTTGLPQSARGKIIIDLPGRKGASVSLYNQNQDYMIILRPDMIGEGPVSYTFQFSWQAGTVNYTTNITAPGGEPFITAGKGSYSDPRKTNTALQTEADILAEMEMLKKGSPDYPRLDISLGAWLSASVSTKKAMPGWYFYFAAKTPQTRGFVYNDLFRMNSTQHGHVMNWMDILGRGSQYFFIAQKEWNGKKYTVEMKDTNTYHIQVSPVKRDKNQNIIDPEAGKQYTLKNYRTVVEPVFPRRHAWNAPLQFGTKLLDTSKTVFFTLFFRLPGENVYRSKVMDLQSSTAFQAIELTGDETASDSIEYYYTVTVMRSQNSRDSDFAVINNNGRPFVSICSNSPAKGPAVKASQVTGIFKGGRSLETVPFRLSVKNLPTGYRVFVMMPFYETVTSYPMEDKGGGAFAYDHTLSGTAPGQTARFFYVIRDAAGRTVYSTAAAEGYYEIRLVQRLEPFSY